ncbi:alpha/beta hydrolase [Eubacteriaceae bacterium ES2]|nr:alpha/beta hydrolase [Eubacteriaceae bacterium ES2]
MKKILKVTLLLIYCLVLAMLTYLGDSSRADLNALKALESDQTLTVVETNDAILFVPAETDWQTGLIFYPGGKVAPQAYAPLMRKIAENEVVTVITKMPFNLAVFNQDAASKIMTMDEVQGINSWYIAGHSLGGSMASDYAVSNSDQIQAVILMGAYPNKSPAETGLSYLAITGSEDKIVNRESFADAIWPQNTKFETIDGGNHSYFGDYGLQEGDSPGSISRDQQQQLTALWIDSFIKETNQ